MIEPDKIDKVIEGMRCCLKAGAIYTGELGIIGGDECSEQCPYKNDINESPSCIEKLANDNLEVIVELMQVKMKINIPPLVDPTIIKCKDCDFKWGSTCYGRPGSRPKVKDDWGCKYGERKYK